MKIKELIEHLKCFDPEYNILIMCRVSKEPLNPDYPYTLHQEFQFDVFPNIDYIEYMRKKEKAASQYD